MFQANPLASEHSWFIDVCPVHSSCPKLLLSSVTTDIRQFSFASAVADDTEIQGVVFLGGCSETVGSAVGGLKTCAWRLLSYLLLQSDNSRNWENLSAFNLSALKKWVRFCKF